MQEKLQTCQNLNLRNFKRTYFEDYIHATLYHENGASDFNQLYIIPKYCPIK